MLIFNKAKDIIIDVMEFCEGDIYLIFMKRGHGSMVASHFWGWGFDSCLDVLPVRCVFSLGILSGFLQRHEL